MRRAARACRAGVVLAALSVTPATARERPPPHPADEIEVFSGAEDVAPGEAPKRPALAYWRVRATLRVPATDRPVHVGLLVPLSDGRQDVLARRAGAPGLGFRETPTPPNLRAEWTGDAAKGVTIGYELAVRVSESRCRGGCASSARGSRRRTTSS